MPSLKVLLISLLFIPHAASVANDVIRVIPTVTTDLSTLTFSTANEALLMAEIISQKKKMRGDTTWTEVRITPSVYWIDDPNTPETVRPKPGETIPYGLCLRLDRVRIVGTSGNAKDVILACQRGQTQGADGNFTMLHITGDDVSVENITFGNYCNVDLVYPSDPSLNRPRRAEAIVQAQLIICNGDRYHATNCEFISRLNLCPFAGAKRAVFDNCYFECTDDALCGTGIYNRCRFTLFSSKPFYATSPQGAVFHDCDIHCKTRGTQYLTKVSSPVRLDRCRFTSDDPDLKIEWTRKPNPKDKCYMTDCTLNGKPLIVPTTPDIPMPVGFPLFGIIGTDKTEPGRWTIDAHCPNDLGEYSFTPDTSRPAWVYGEGMDGAEGCYGLIQNVRGARLMYTSLKGENYHGQRLSLNLDPCKGPGQGFGSATGQYLDICIKFDTQTLSGYGIRFIRTPRHDRAVEVCLVQYDNGNIKPLTPYTKCTLFRRGCHLEIEATESSLSATITNPNTPNDKSNAATTQTITSPITSNPYGGIHIQHTGSTGASATVISALHCRYDNNSINYP